MELKFGLATPSNLWALDWQARQQTLAGIVNSGFDHVFMADHVSFRNGSGTDGFVEVASLRYPEWLIEIEVMAVLPD